MLNSKSFLAVDFGAGTLKLAEFEQNEAGGLRLTQYATRSLGLEGSQESTRETVVLKALQEMLSEKAFRSKEVNACAPGFHVFSKFVKLPPVDTSKVTQIIQYEAQQNVPFPLEEVVWDYQILGTSATGELEVLLVAIKTDIVDGLFRIADGSGLRLQLVDVSPAALCNAFRYNYADMEGEGCTMLLDIGAKSSNLLFFEKGKVYARSINIGANAITQDFATEGKVKFNDAEVAKIEKGFVSLGGAYEDPEDPQAAAISKIARQVMTRLHIQVNQTIQFYRGQQAGSAPQRLFLSGGASVMAYTAQFFAEKLNVQVDYFNPFRNVQIDPSINVEELARVAHSYGEVVGLGLRNMAHCPVELNLMPKASIQRQELQQKKPYFIAAMYSLVAVVFAIGFFYAQVVSLKNSALEELQAKVNPLVVKKQELDRVKGELEKLKKDTERVLGLVDDRFYWPLVTSELRRIFVAAEDKTKAKIGADVGIWLEAFQPQVPVPSITQQSVAPQSFEGSGKEGFVAAAEDLERYRENVPSQQPMEGTATAGSDNEISVISIVCRGVDMERINPGANNDLIFALKNEIAASSFFAGEGTELDAIVKEESGLTFSCNMVLKLKRPLKVQYLD